MLSAPVVALYTECDNGRKAASEELLASALFAEILKGGRQAFIILDAVDECPRDERECFFDLFLEHAGLETTTANFLFTSRKEHDIEERMSEVEAVIKLHVMPIFTGNVAADIRLYVANQLATRRSTRNWDKSLRKDVEDSIAEGACGIWVSFSFCFPFPFPQPPPPPLFSSSDRIPCDGCEEADLEQVPMGLLPARPHQKLQAGPKGARDTEELAQDS